MIRRRAHWGASLIFVLALAVTAPRPALAQDTNCDKQATESERKSEQRKEAERTEQLLAQMAMSDGYTPKDKPLLDVHPEERTTHTYSQNVENSREQQAGSKGEREGDNGC